MSRVASIVETVPEPCLVAGTWLRPFCLGHHLLFVRLGLAFADRPNASESKENIMLGMAICAGKSYEAILGQMLYGHWPATFDRWVKDLRGPWYRRNRTNWKESDELFRAYLADGYAMPPLMQHTGKSEIEIGAPWEELLKCRLVSAGFLETDVLNGYLPGRWYDYFTVKEQDQVVASERFAASGHRCRWRRTFYTAALDRKLRGEA